MFTKKDLDPIGNMFKGIMIIISLIMFYIGYLIGKGI